jgi:hypothetical protein
MENYLTHCFTLDRPTGKSPLQSTTPCLLPHPPRNGPCLRRRLYDGV